MGAKGVMDLVAEAKEKVENLTPTDVAAELENGVLLVDLREREELETQGAIPGALHAPRGMLEFYADASTPYHREEFYPAARIVLYCPRAAARRSRARRCRTWDSRTSLTSTVVSRDGSPAAIRFPR